MSLPASAVQQLVQRDRHHPAEQNAKQAYDDGLDDRFSATPNRLEKATCTGGNPFDCPPGAYFVDVDTGVFRHGVTP
jgi:hypothetical protein